MTLTEKHREVERRAEDFPWFAERLFKIRNKSGALVPLSLNKGQRYLHDRLEEQRRRQGYVRAVVPKGRQTGISTYIDSRHYHQASRRRGQRAFILAHIEDATRNLLKIVSRGHNNIPLPLRPVAGRDSEASGLDFPDLDSSYHAGTAGGREPGRSFTIHLLHGSEAAFWPNASTIAAGLLQAVPHEEGTEVIFESTANGLGGYFYNLCKEADEGVDAAGMPSEYILIFVPWYWMDSYQAKVPDGFRLIGPNSAPELLERYGDEVSLVEKVASLKEPYGHRLTREQLAWRRFKIRELETAAAERGLTGLHLFRQEYPCWWQEAFLFSGSSVFSPFYLERMAERTRDPIARGVLSKVGEEIRFRVDPSGWLDVWEFPNIKRDYALGADVSEGLPKGDRSVAHVLRRGDINRQTARLHPRNADPAEFAGMCVLTAEWYRRCWLAIERNNGMGMAAVRSAVKTGFRHLFYMQSPDEAQAKDRPPPGWLTTEASRGVLVGGLSETIREQTLEVFCLDTVLELGTFVRNKAGRPEASEGARDDEVLSLGIANETLRRTDPVPGPADEPTDTEKGKAFTQPDTRGWMG